MAQRAPKQWALTRNETITSYESWRQNLLYILSLDTKFSRFLTEGATWAKKSAANPNRGFAADDNTIPEADRLTAAQKSAMLDLMLGQIANFCPVISRNTILKASTSLGDVWQKIRQHFGFQASGSHFLDLAAIRLEAGERPEDLFQRLMAFFEDNLLIRNSTITHYGATILQDEDMTPTLENTVVALWLQLINPGLPALVKQRYGAELRNKTLASIKPEISQALDSLLEELQSLEETKVMRTYPVSFSKQAKQPRPKLCCLCKAAGRPGYSSHYLSTCKFLPLADKRAIARTRLTQLDDEEGDEIEYQYQVEDVDQLDTEPVPEAFSNTPQARRVNVVQSPYLNCYYKKSPIRLTIDTGATSNMVNASFARAIGLPVVPASQLARQADGITPLDVVGEVRCSLVRGTRTFHLDALCVSRLDVDVLAGTPFLANNDIATRPAKRQVIIGGEEIVNYGGQSTTNTTVRRAQVVRGPDRQTVVLPGEWLEVETPKGCTADNTWALEPRYDSCVARSAETTEIWPPPQAIESVNNKLCLQNLTETPILIRKNEHFCQIIPVTPTTITARHSETGSCLTKCEPRRPFSTCISTDPDHILPDAMTTQFINLHQQFDSVFEPSISCYNGASGNIQAHVNMGPVLPPQRKGRMPQYSRDKLLQLQDKFDELEEAGVFAKPEEKGINVEYLNLSFLIQKPNGGTRLVTAFGEVGQYSKPQPSLMPKVDDTLRSIARWKYLIKTDLLKSFYQIPLAKSSMKYCGVATPFKGIRVYTRCAMGMPGSETALEELMSRVLGQLIQDGATVKLADDLYCGGSSPEEALQNWSRVLSALKDNNLKLNASKTVICPKSTVILGWVWEQGVLRASPHRLATLAAVEPPQTVKSLRSFIGSFKVLSRVLPGYAEKLSPLESAIAGRQSSDRLEWTDELIQTFRQAQASLKDAKAITLPLPKDELWIVTDASKTGIAATLYSLRDAKLVLSGFFNAKLKSHQIAWLPCELEALSISAAVKHFSPYIIQATANTQVLTDSRPCVQAYQKLCRGEFSNSARVTTFLSAVSRYQICVKHIAGVANLASDYASRNPSACTDDRCQVCRFVEESEISVVGGLTVSDVCDGRVTMPFTNRNAWRASQVECADLRRTHSHLTQGTRPSKKMTNILDVKRYIRVVSIATDGLLVVKLDQPFQPLRERIVVPRGIIDGLVTALHLRLGHPSCNQMKKLVPRYFYALDLDAAITTAVHHCHLCTSLQASPAFMEEQTTSPPPHTIGTSFAADVMRRCRQYVLVVREVVSSYTVATLIPGEKHNELRDALIMLLSGIPCFGDSPTTIRVDPAPGFSALSNDAILLRHNLQLEIGCAKNRNKNPVAERCVQELGKELLRVAPEGGPISPLLLSLAVAHMNSRIRKGGLSAREVWTQRDQITGEQLPIHDDLVIQLQHQLRQSNHLPSMKSKTHGKRTLVTPDPSVGSLVYLRCDSDKTKAKEKYIVTKREAGHIFVRKFAKNQLRLKEYKVKSSLCTPITPSEVLPAHEPIRDMPQWSDPECSEDDEFLSPTVAVSPDPAPLPNRESFPTCPDSTPGHTTQESSGVIPDSVRECLLEAPDGTPLRRKPIMSNNVVHSPTLPTPVVTAPTRSSSRQKKAPQWLSNKDWMT